MFQPQNVLITRQGDDRFHDHLEREPGLMMAEPSVGEPLHIFLNTGLVMTTTPVTKVANDGEDTVVETHNSRYRLRTRDDPTRRRRGEGRARGL